MSWQNRRFSQDTRTSTWATSGSRYRSRDSRSQRLSRFLLPCQPCVNSDLGFGELTETAFGARNRRHAGFNVIKSFDPAGTRSDKSLRECLGCCYRASPRYPHVAAACRREDQRMVPSRVGLSGTPTYPRLMSGLRSERQREATSISASTTSPTMAPSPSLSVEPENSARVGQHRRGS